MIGTGPINLPPWPEAFDVMQLLERGLFIKHHKKTDTWEIRVETEPQ